MVMNVVGGIRRNHLLGPHLNLRKNLVIRNRYYKLKKTGSVYLMSKNKTLVDNIFAYLSLINGSCRSVVKCK